MKTEKDNNNPLPVDQVNDIIDSILGRNRVPKIMKVIRELPDYEFDMLMVSVRDYIIERSANQPTTKD